MATEQDREPALSHASMLAGAVFLSYASEDAPAAERIANALRAAGVEVWFDRNELRGGDAWDQAIRDQISACTLFIPIISANAHARVEGYFRLEWKLAIDRSHRMAPKQPFLLPVVIDDTRRSDDAIPDRFRDLQWTRLPGGETTPAFVERVRRLLSPASTVAPDPAHSASSAVASGAALAPRLIRRRMGVVSAMIAAAVVLALGYVGFERMNRSKPSAPATASIAVLPLANESGEASQQYFSDGISEDLITALGQFPGLKVIGRTSSFQFRDSREDSRSIGAKLGVAHLLEGSVRRAGDMVRVTAELIDTADGSTQWSERYDRPYKDFFALQDEITRAVASALRARLQPSARAEAQSERPPGGSLEAYNAFLQGEFYAHRNTQADMRKAIEYYTQATELDPHYALAWSNFSRTLTDFGQAFLEGSEAQETYAKAREAVDRAAALAPSLAAAHVARGFLLQYADFDWRGAEAEYRRALALSPSDGDAKLNLGYLRATFGELDSAIEFTRQALATEPLRPNWHNWLARYLLAQNRLDEAERAIRKALELNPTGVGYHTELVKIEIQRGNAQAALEAAQHEAPGLWQDHALALARQVGGDKSAADAALRTLIEKDANSAAYEIAQVYALRNDAKATFEWLNRDFSNRDGDFTNLLSDPFILRYKDDPRFAAFCRKVGLPVPGEIRQQT